MLPAGAVASAAAEDIDAAPRQQDVHCASAGQGCLVWSHYQQATGTEADAQDSLRQNRSHIITPQCCERHCPQQSPAGQPSSGSQPARFKIISAQTHLSKHVFTVVMWRQGLMVCVVGLQVAGIWGLQLREQAAVAHRVDDLQGSKRHVHVR